MEYTIAMGTRDLIGTSAIIFVIGLGFGYYVARIYFGV